ncbi:hypothetical protein [Serratia ureilytica]|uniref:hypothetical protein n=1 Tax=Serratia ureilytica TaxID=300181 RepID=UPI001E3544E2|nr:hypothetical protein [Serratia ureilytica]
MRFTHLVPLIIGMAAFSLSGCSTYHDVALQQKEAGLNSPYYLLQPPVYVGDRLKYGLKDGSGGELTVAKVKPKDIVADSGKIIPLSQLSFLQRKDISEGKTAALVGGGAVATAAIVFVAGITIMAAGIAASA